MLANALAAAPALTADRAAIDFGAYSANLAKQHAFVLKNTGDQVLKIIQIRKTCGCSEAKIDRTELPPGATASLGVTIKAGSIAGPYSKNLFVESNDPKQRFLMLLLNGNAVPLVTVKPQDKIYVGTMPVRHPWTQEFELQTTQDNVVFGPVAGKDAEAALTPIDRRRFKLTVQLASIKPGAFMLQVLVPVKAPAGWPPVEILISGRRTAER